MEKRKGRRHEKIRETRLLQEHMDHIDGTGVLHALRLRAAFQVGIGQHPVHRRLVPRPVDFEIAHDHEPFALHFQIDEGVRRDEAGGVIQIGIGFARRDKQRGGLVRRGAMQGGMAHEVDAITYEECYHASAT